MSAAGKKRMGEVAALGCVLCIFKGIEGSPAEVHHLRTGTGAARRASDLRTIPLCPPHHRTSNEALHAMGRKAWERHHGVSEADLYDLTCELLGVMPC